MNPIPSLMVVDNFCPAIDAVRQSALDSGFGTWAPNKGLIGSSKYEGMNFQAWHAPMIHSLALAIGRPVYPNSMFVRVTNRDTEAAYTHSDRESGDYTCVAYLSEHKDEVSGTGFFRHRATGLTEMPPFCELRKKKWAKLRRDIVHGGDKEWEQTAFVKGIYGRAVIFRAPLFHARCPKHGIGNNAENGRMIWASHFHVEE